MMKFASALAGIALAGVLSTAASAQTKWDMPVPYPDGNFHTRNVVAFAADIDKATKGALNAFVKSAAQQRLTREAMRGGQAAGRGRRAPARPTPAATSAERSPAQGREAVRASQMQ